MYICVRFLGDELLLLCLVMVLYHHTLPTRQIRYPFENDIWLLVTAAEEKKFSLFLCLCLSHPHLACSGQNRFSPAPTAPGVIRGSDGAHMLWLGKNVWSFL